MITYKKFNIWKLHIRQIKILIAFFILTSCQQKQEGIIIFGTTEGIPDQEIDLILDIYYGQNELLQTTKIEGGRFEFKTTLEKPASALSIKFKDEKYALYPIRKSTPLGMMLIDNGNNIHLTIKAGSTKAQKGTGKIYPEISVINESPSFKKYLKFKEKLNEKFKARRIKLDSMFNSLNIDWSSFKEENLDVETKKNLKTVQTGNVQLIKEKVDYLKASILENSDNLEGVFILYEFINMTVDSKRNQELWPEWYSNLEPVIKETHLAQAFKSRMEKDKQIRDIEKQVSVGKYFKDFTLPDQNGEKVTLSSLLKEEKYVLIDFWASWCGPCRFENPNILKAYNKYKDKGLTVVAVSLDKDKESWLKAIEEDEMPWVHLSDLLGNKSEVVKNYGITGIPASFLLNGEGEIIAKDLKGEDLHKKLEGLYKEKN